MKNASEIHEMVFYKREVRLNAQLIKMEVVVYWLCLKRVLSSLRLARLAILEKYVHRGNANKASKDEGKATRIVTHYSYLKQVDHHLGWDLQAFL